MIEQLIELRNRLNEKSRTLMDMAGQSKGLTITRLVGKASGVDLAVSFIDELIREERRRFDVV